MSKGRLEAFSDGVVAILITVMVLDLKVPREATTLADLLPLWPIFLSYLLSFVHLAIYWNNHHHLLQVTQRIHGGILWANLHLLFWLSLVPFVTTWMGQNHFATEPTALYGVVLLMSGFAYWILVQTILCAPGGNELLAAAIGRDLKGKLSLVLYTAAIALCFIHTWIACAIYALVALMWLIPDPRIERALTHSVKEE